MRVAIRTDSSTQIGSGHLMRCLTLAKELRQRNVEVFFICRDLSGSLITRVNEEGFRIHELLRPNSENISLTEDYSNWLGVSQEQDANETLGILSREVCDLIIVDHYSLDIYWEKEVRASVNKIMVIDDLANRQHDCDFLLDQNYFGELTSQRYNSLVPGYCNCMLGPSYALVQPIYRGLRNCLPHRDGEVRNILVFFGACDHHNLTAQVLEALIHPDFLEISVEVVIGENHPNFSSIADLASLRAHTKLHTDLPSLAGLMVRADLMIGAGGSTTWERLCVGLPGLIASVANNQREFTSALFSDKYQVELEINHLTERLLDLVKQPTELQSISKKSRRLVDGYGLTRVIHQITGIQTGEFKIRKARRSDFNLLSQPKSSNSLLKKALEKNNDNKPGEDKGCYKPMILVGADESDFPIGYARFDYVKSRKECVLDIGIESFLEKKDSTSLFLQNILDKWRYIGFENLTSSQVLNSKCVSPRMFIRLSSSHQTNIAEKNKNLRITILSDKDSWFNGSARELQTIWLQKGYSVLWVNSPADLIEGDICFILSCSTIIKPAQLRLHQYNLVIHASDLPDGRGWSPMSWQILDGKNRICITLFEAVEELDAGKIYKQSWVELDGTELVDEWRKKQVETTKRLCLDWVAAYPESTKKAREQIGQPSFYSRRRPEQSALDPKKSIEEQFNLLRVVDNHSYPAFFEINGQKYKLSIDKI